MGIKKQHGEGCAEGVSTTHHHFCNLLTMPQDMVQTLLVALL